jgi:hypothetical protein
VPAQEDDVDRAVMIIDVLPRKDVAARGVQS